MSDQNHPGSLEEALAWDYSAAQQLINEEVSKPPGRSYLDGAADTVRCIQARMVGAVNPLHLGREARTALFYLSAATSMMALSNFYYYAASKSAQMATREGATPTQAARALASPPAEAVVTYEIPKRVRKRTRSPRTHIHRRR